MANKKKTTIEVNSIVDFLILAVISISQIINRIFYWIVLLIVISIKRWYIALPILGLVILWINS